jgi:heparanase
VSENYGPAEYGRDSKIFGEFLRKESPGTLYLGPGSAAEGLPLEPMPSAPASLLKIVPSEALLKATGPLFDGFSYHVYYTRSHRCMGANGTDVNRTLDSEWFSRNLTVESFYAKLRDEYLPGKPLWLTETGEASCGGDTWASEFVDSFRLLDQFGGLAQRSVKAVMHNTLASSDYGLVDEETLEPRPNYWAALLWKRLMGTRALDTGIAASSPMRVYAQCMRGKQGGVALLVMNVDKASTSTLKLPVSGLRYTLSSPDLLSKRVLLNGSELRLGADGSVPEYNGQQFKRGVVSFAPLSISVLAMPDAANTGCRL